MIDKYTSKGPIPGDVLLFDSGNKWNKVAQSRRTGLDARYTHVALCTGLGTFIHAVKPAVDHIVSGDLFGQYDGPWRAIRHSGIERIGRERQMDVNKAADFFLEMAYVDSYRKFLNGDELDQETFCSQLIKRIFSRLGVEIFSGYESVFPVHFQDLPETDPTNWRDVKDEQLIGQEILRNDGSMRKLAVDMCGVSKSIRKTTLETHQMHGLMQQLHQGFKEIDEQMGFTGVPTMDVPKPVMPMDYWDTKEPKKSD